MRFLLPITILLAFLLSACSGADRLALTLADTVMEEHPDSALAILHSIDCSRLSDRDLPYFALLMTQAQVKNDIPLDSDSLISIAYGKYAGAWRGDKGIRSSFYMGEVFFNQEKPREAMRHYLSSYEESKRRGNDYWHAKSAERIADLFFNAYNYPEATRYRKEAIEFFGKSNRLTNQRYAIADLASELTNASKADQAVVILDSLLACVRMQTQTDTLLLDYIRRMKIDALVVGKRTDLLDSTDMQLLARDEYRSMGAESTIIGSYIDASERSADDVFLQSKLFDSTSSNQDKAAILYTLFENAKDVGNIKMAIDITDSLLVCQNAVVEDLIRESIISEERDFYSEIAIRHKHMSRFYMLAAVIALITAGFVTFLIWRMYNLKMNTRKAELEATVEALLQMKENSYRLAQNEASMAEEIRRKTAIIDSIKDSLSEKSNKITCLEMEMNKTREISEGLLSGIQEKDLALSQLKTSLVEKELSLLKLNNQLDTLRDDFKNQQLALCAIEEELSDMVNTISSKNIVMESLFKEKWITLNMLCDEYYEKGDSEKLRNRIINDIEKELKKMTSPKRLAEIEAAADSYMNDIIAKLRAQCPGLTQGDMTLAILTIAGFSVKSICFLTGAKRGAVYMRKARLIESIEKSSAPDSDLFISKLK